MTSVASSTSRPATPRGGRFSGAQGGEKRIELVERLGHPGRRSGGTVESFLRGIEIVHDQQRLAALFLEGHGGDWAVAFAFLIGPDEARVGCHFDVSAEERHL